jgi:hypothetical protein
MFTENSCGFDDLLIGFSVVAVIFAILGALGADIYLASSQWMMIAGLLALWGIFIRVRK